MRAQLLAFTRVFLVNPATEHLIERAVSKLLQGRTGIVIAHRRHRAYRVR